VGIEKDRQIVSDCLSPYFDITHYNHDDIDDKPKGYMRIFLEEIYESHLDKINFFIPNQEWFVSRKYHHLMRRVELILTKTLYATNLFKRRYSNVHYLSFASLDYGFGYEKKLQVFRGFPHIRRS
jgi:hypothetical protein